VGAFRGGHDPLDDHRRPLGEPLVPRLRSADGEQHCGDGRGGGGDVHCLSWVTRDT
jgi:hypothetical protein